MSARSPRVAFTMIELIIAMAVGMIIVATTVAGVRAASQAVAVATRLSTENALMRSGIARAHDEVDFWTASDDPEKPDSDRPLKRAGGWAGLSFQPFTSTFAASSTGEEARGWDPDEKAWAAANPRSWLRGNLIEKDGTDLRFGRYAIFANTASTLAASDFGVISVANADPLQPATTYGYGPTEPPRHWYYRQVSGLAHALGFYGLLEYLPANSMYVFYGPAGGAVAANSTPGDAFKDDSITNLGGISQWCIHPGGNHFNNGDGGQQTSRGKYRNTYATSYGFVDPSSSPINGNQNALADESRRHWSLGYDNNAGSQADFNLKTAVSNRLLTLKPAHWPDVVTSVQRFIKNARHATISRVRWISPLTGDSAELSYASFGTTLRGARQQRRPDTGWARYDNDTDHSADPAYRTLDSY